MIDFNALKAPFPPERIHWRVGATTQDKKRGLPLAYIDARDVMERLDTVCGPENWQCKYSHANGKTCCDIGISCCIAEDEETFKVEWIWKADGAGDTDVEQDKGAFSDAFKRAAVRWGIGRYLYDVKAPWVRIEKRGNSYVIPDDELNTLLRFLQGKNYTPTEPANSSDPNWRGPLNKMQLKEEMTNLHHRIGDARTPDELDTALDEYAQVLEQCQHDAPGILTGDGLPTNDGYVPTNERIRAKREFFNHMNVLNAG